MSLPERFRPALHWITAHRHWLSAGFMLLVVGIAALVIRRVLQDVSLADVRQSLAAITPIQILLSAMFASLSYLVLTGYDVLALHAIGKPQRWRRAALASFTAYTFSHNLGFAPLTAAAARWRAYRGTNINAGDIARIVVIAGVTFWFGIFVLLGIALLVFPGALRLNESALPYPAQAAIGAAIMAGIALYLWACATRSAPISLFGWTLPVPTLRQALHQFLLAATDMALASAALLVLLPADSWHHYPAFLVAYVVAMVVALLTHAPGGLGVFEAVVLVTLPDVDKPALVSALILYRLIYYWIPLLLAALLLALNEIRMWRVQRVERRGLLGRDHPL